MNYLEIPMARQLVNLWGAAGFVRFLRKSLPLMFRSEAEVDEYFVNTSAILPDFQGKGIGTQLLGNAKAKARAQGLQKCSLCVEIGNHRAGRLYERLGSRVVKTTLLDQLERRIGYKGFQRMVKVIG